MTKKKKPEDIALGDKVILFETGFEYLVTWLSDKSILIKRQNSEHFIPLSLISINDSLKRLTGYRLFKFNSLPEWFVKKNNI